MLKEKEEDVRVYTSKKESDDEVDLGVFFNWVNRGFKRVGRFFSYIFYLLVKRIVIVGMVLLIGLAIGFLMFKKTRPFYKSHLVLYLTEIRNDFVEGQLAIFSQMVNEGNYDALADRLDISPDAAREIKSVKFSNLDQDIIEKDSVLAGSPFKIELELYNNQLFESMEPAITGFLENNQFFAKQKLIRENKYRKLINKYKTDLLSLDSIKIKATSPRGPVNGFVYGEALDPTEMYREGIEMYESQVDLEAELDRLDNIQVVNSFAPKRLPDGPVLLEMLLMSAGIALVVGLFVAHAVEKRFAR